LVRRQLPVVGRLLVAGGEREERQNGEGEQTGERRLHWNLLWWLGHMPVDPAGLWREVFVKKTCCRAPQAAAQ
jgi:hypothetical protein